MNGVAVAQQTIVADGTLREITFDVPVEKSSWVALRILPATHTNPVFVIVGEKPIREKRSIEWCLKSVDACWGQKEKTYLPGERDEARAAYEHARETYRARLTEAE